MIMQILAGGVSGVVSGMGIGGGVVLIPILTLLLGYGQKTAQGINILYFLPTSAAALAVHIKNKLVDWKMCINMGIGGVLGAVAGGLILPHLSPEALRKIFAWFLIAMGICEFFAVGKLKKEENGK